MSRYYYVSIVPVKEGGYTASIYDFPEAITQGDTIEEAIEMAEDTLAISAEEYTRERRPIPAPSSFEVIKQKTLQEMEEYKEHIDTSRDVFYQLLKMPNVETKPVKISVSFPKNVLEQIDKKAESYGMTRSGFLAQSALAYEG